MNLFSRSKKPVQDIEAIAREAATTAAREVASELLRAPAHHLSQLAEASTLQRRAPNVAAYAMEDPRRFTDFQSPRTRPGSSLSVDSLRRLARHYDILASCIAHLKDQVIKTPLHIAAKDDKDQTRATRKAVEEAKAFFDTYGGLGGSGYTREDFEGKWLDDLLVIGAGAFYFEYWTVGSVDDRKPDVVRAIDASTIRPLVTPYGFPPDGEVYEQVVQGQRVAGFTRDELAYAGLPIFAQSHSPYYLSAVELLVMVVGTALKSDEWNRTWLTDGNVPDYMVQVPKEWTPDQIMEYADYFDGILSGNSQNRHKARIVPEGVHGSAMSRKDADFQEFDNWLRDRTCSLMGVNPASIGFHSRTYKDSQEGAMDSTRDNRVAQLLQYRATRYNDICRRRGWTTIHVTDQETDPEDAKARAERHQIEIQSGRRTINECRQEAGDDAIEGGDVLMVSNSYVTLDRMINPPQPTPAPDIAPKDDSNPEASKSERAASAFRRWERKAINRVKSGRPASCSFQTGDIGDEELADIQHSLEHCETADEVRALFAPFVERAASERKDLITEEEVEKLVRVDTKAARALAFAVTDDEMHAAMNPEQIKPNGKK